LIERLFFQFAWKGQRSKEIQNETHFERIKECKYLKKDLIDHLIGLNEDLIH